jgi:hypothetical protein
MTLLEWGAAALVVGVVLYALGIMPKTQAALAFIGTCIVTGGLFGHLLARITVDVAHLTNTLTGKIFGTAIPGLLVIVLLIYFVHDMHPKKNAKKRTFFIGIALAACLVAGIAPWQTLNNVPGSVRTGVGTNLPTNG